MPQDGGYIKIKDKSVTITKYWWFKDGMPKSKVDGLKSITKKLINNLFLNKVGFKLIKNTSAFRPEQRYYISDEKVLRIRNSKISNYLCEYFKSFGVVIGIDFCQSQIIHYERIFRDAKISDLNGGMGFNNGLILFILTALLDPKKIIESGIWCGYTTLLLDKASCDDSEIHCYDINLDRNEYKSRKAYYFNCDISESVDISYVDFDLALFDDHVAHFDRILFCLRNNVKAIILDDDVAVEQVHSDGWPPIPTASMVYNYSEIPHEFSWVGNGLIGEADIKGLAVDDIVSGYRYIPFPNLSHLTGYENVSFTSLLIRL